MSRPQILLLVGMPPDAHARLMAEFTGCDILEGRDAAARERWLDRAVITYGLPPLDRLPEAPALRWIQLISAGVPQPLCAVAQARGLTVTNLAGLYGPTIAEHALALMLILSRNLHVALRNQVSGKWDRSVSRGLADLHGKTLAVVGLGNIGQSIARLARAHGMRGRLPADAAAEPGVDRVYPREDLHAMLAEADDVAVAAPLTAGTEGMLGPAEFAAMKSGVVYINVSRGPVAREEALLAALRSGHVAAAGLDVFAVEPLSADHPFWTMPQVLVSPHYSGETVNDGSLPAERFMRNLRAWLAGDDMEGVVNLELGY